jgi:hypothetical protein
MLPVFKRRCRDVSDVGSERDQWDLTVKVDEITWSKALFSVDSSRRHDKYIVYKIR